MSGNREGIVQPFEDGWDQYDFNVLASIDPAWQALYTDHDSLEDYDAGLLEEQALELIGREDYSDHILGYTHYRGLRTDRSQWLTVGSIYSRFTPYRYDQPSAVVRDAVCAKLRPLLDQGVLEGNLSYFHDGPQFPHDSFPDLGDEFFDFVRRFTRQCGGEASASIVVLEYFDEEDLHPYKFWGGYGKIFELVDEGKLTFDSGCIIERKEESPEVGLARAALGSQLGLDNRSLDKKLAALNLQTVRIVKPKQRGERYQRDKW